MIRRIKKSNEIIFAVPMNVEIDLDALNLVAFNENSSLCKCEYLTIGKRHNLIYPIKELTNLKEYKLNYVETCTLLQVIIKMIDYLKQKGMHLKNIRIKTNDIYMLGEQFKFIYLPLLQKEDISAEDFLFKLLRTIHSADEEVTNLKKHLKGLGTFQLIKEYISSLEQKDKMMENMVDCSDEEEAETSLLSTNANIVPESEGETTILSQHTTAFMPNEFSECETTVLSNAAVPGESEIITKEGLYELYLLRVSSGEQIHINKPIYSIGKDVNQMDYVLGNASVSRNHATIYSEGEKYFLVDNGSTNGSALEGVRIREGEKVELEDGYIISLGNEVFQVLLERKES